MNPAEFAAKWAGSTRDRACRLPGALHRPLPDARRPDPQRGRPDRRLVRLREGRGKPGGGDGFADVWKRGHFAWEYKGKRKDLDRRLQPAAPVSGGARKPAASGVATSTASRSTPTSRIRRRPSTNSTSTDLAATSGAAEGPACAHGPTRRSCARVEAADELTGEAAGQLRRTSLSRLRGRGTSPERVAHFLDKLLFCLFAEDAGLLPKGLLSRLAEPRSRARRSPRSSRRLFDQMSNERRLLRRGRSSGSTAGSSTAPRC